MVQLVLPLNYRLPYYFVNVVPALYMDGLIINALQDSITMGQTNAKINLTVAEIEEAKWKRKEIEEEERGKWDNPIEFFLSCLGYAVGLGNVWRFPYLCYKNGGAAFLIPYCLMLFVAGLPLFFMELALGQYTSLGPNKLYTNLSPIFSGLGWAMVVMSGLTAIYYNVIIAWTIYYTFASLTNDLPWGHCDNPYNSKDCYTTEAAEECKSLGLHYYDGKCYAPDDYCSMGGFSLLNETFCVSPSNNSDIRGVEGIVPRISASEDFFKNKMLGITGKTWEDVGEMRWELVGCLALAWILVAGCLAKGVKSSGKVVYFTATFPYVVLIILLVRGLTLEGAYQGIEYYLLKPDLSRLRDIKVWNDAAVQIFYSTGVGFGGLITLSSYNKINNNCMRDAIIVALCNSATSLFAGLVIFSMLGFLAHELKTDIEDVVSSGSGLAFVVYPTAVTHMPVPPLWSFLFFIMLITLGLDSQFAMVETVTTALLDQFVCLRKRKLLVVCLTCFILFLCGLTLCLEGGLLMFELFNTFSAGLCLIIVSILEVFVVSYVFGFNRFMEIIRNEMDIHIPVILHAFWAITMCFITPLALILILGFSLYHVSPVGMEGYVYPEGIQVLGWLIFGSSVVFLPLGAIYSLIFKRDRCQFSPTENFCPASKRT
ncbi:unnamed protein product [Meganyctiphanes norvegica]|uniref:Transporter n=1 Tax=Meganyctiphanes norvegica TaxID=48144 RepID=A0AAV2RE49_MEGNR